jgi:hypothetical protein
MKKLFIQSLSLWEKTPSSTNGAGYTGSLHVEEWSYIAFSHGVQKSIQNGSKILMYNLKLWSPTCKHRENIEKFRHRHQKMRTRIDK